MRRFVVPVLAVLAAAVLGGCSGSAESTPARGDSTSAAVTDKPAKQRTAEKIANALTAEVATAKVTKVYTAQDDPNKLLGRPNGYQSKVAFADSRVPESEVEGTKPDAVERGGSVEVFADAESAKKRADYIQNIAKNMPAAGEYDYVAGPVLVRVSRVLPPDQAKEYETARRNVTK
ncbi:hypothetical protein GCM10012275_39880 [Longimycelium tulufanense]|uniref:Secreted protein n=1 Tax=Longimycelium tulufanense TaxID=907463 RepID=A0A8J3FXS7_9PSEU|nr:hypothetical protein [Longimycelium tulufanense]GGM65382.1 hypothetical protein GCM10012275_39880 [Longimycelium tulufanense]